MRTEEIEMVRQAISITLPKECVDWVDEKVKTRIYASRSHALEVLILKEHACNIRYSLKQTIKEPVKCM